MRTLLHAVLLVTILPHAAAAATFTGTTQATFRVREVLDGTTTTATKTGGFNISLTTDYTTMRWSMDFDVDLLISGGPSQSFETRLLASGSLDSRRCPTGPCSLEGAGDPSPLSFPDGTGKSGAGSYFLLGSAEWTLTDRVLTAVRERHSPEKSIAGSANVSGNEAYNPGSHYLTVANYPTVTLTPGFGSFSSWLENGLWKTEFISGLLLGRITDGANYLEVTVSNFPSTFTLAEIPPGDFNSNQTVDAADYTIWRDSPGLLAPFLTNYDVWRSNFGASSAGFAGAIVPEPASLLMLGISFALASCLYRARMLAQHGRRSFSSGVSHDMTR